jgi:hypothetical protein
MVGDDSRIRLKKQKGEPDPNHDHSVGSKIKGCAGKGQGLDLVLHSTLGSCRSDTVVMNGMKLKYSPSALIGRFEIEDAGGELRRRLTQAAHRQCLLEESRTTPKTIPSAYTPRQYARIGKW